MHHPFRKRTISLCSLLLSIALFSVACTETSKNFYSEKAKSLVSQVEPETQQQLERLNIAVIPHRSSKETEENIERLGKYLQESLNLPVNIQLTEDYDNSIELLVQGKVEMAYLGPFSYVKAKEQNAELEPIVAHLEKSTGRPWYTSTIVVNIDSEIKTLEDLKGKRFGFVSKSSTSGYLFPAAHLKKNGFNLEQDFTKINYAGSHNNNVAQLATGKLDAIAIDKSTYLLAQKAGEISGQKYRMIWESQPIPNPPMVISSKLPEKFKLDLKKSFINAPYDLFSLVGNQSDGYTLVQDEDYESIRQVQQLLNLE